MDPLDIQALLGHEDLASTQIYTRVSIQKLKEIHTAMHPGARLERKGDRLDDQAENEKADE